MKITYRPGTEVELKDLGDRWLLTIRQHGRNSNDPEQPYTATYSQGLPFAGAVEDGDLDRFIRNTVHKFEMHEADEWLRIDGQRIFNPHRPGVDPDGYHPADVL